MRTEKGITMKQISRPEAESLFQQSNIIASNIKQNKREMSICFTLSDHRYFFVKYDLHDRVKRYYLQVAK